MKPIFPILPLVALAALSVCVPTAEAGASAQTIDQVRQTLLSNGEYRFEEALDVGYGKVYLFPQIKDGYDVLGRELRVSTDREGSVLSVSGSYFPVGALSAPALTCADAERIVSADGGIPLSSEQVIDGTEYAYRIETADFTYVISASDGEILSKTPRFGALLTTQTNALGEETTLDVRFSNGLYYLCDPVRNLFTYDGQSGRLITSTQEQFDDDLAVSVYENVVRAYDFYTDEDNIGAVRYGINGMNDSVADNYNTRRDEISLNLYVHYNRDQMRENAAFTYLNGTGIMYVGDGTVGGSLYRQGAAADVIAHEYQHGVAQFTAGFDAEGDAGALNEAFSDIFGALVEGHDPSEEEFWLIGEEATDGKGLRSFRSPAYPQRTTVSEKYVCNRPGSHYYHDCDLNGVHVNSTIVSHVQYTLWKKMPSYFTRERIGKLWYATLCALTPRATFDDFARQFLQAAINLGFSEEAQTAVRESLSENGFTSDVCVVNYVNFDGSLLKSYVVKAGETVLPPDEVPEREADDQYEYSFSGWDRDAVFTPVTQDMTIKPVFRKTLRTYTAEFRDSAGKLLKRGTVYYGSAADPPPAPELEGNARCDFEFIGWDNDVSSVLKDTVFTPLYKEIPKNYTVTYYSEGEVLSTVSLHYEDEVPLPTPERFGYTLEGWYLDEECTQRAEDLSVSGDMALYAGWERNGILLWIILGACCLGGGAAGIAIAVLSKRKKR